MQIEQFNDRLAAVRERFVTSLEAKISDTYAELPCLAHGGTEAIVTVETAYRRIHGICGIGTAVGFPATSTAAKEVQRVLVGAYKGRRGLASAEMARLQTTLDVLAATAQAELRSVATPQTSNGDLHACSDRR